MVLIEVTFCLLLLQLLRTWYKWGNRSANLGAVEEVGKESRQM